MHHPYYLCKRTLMPTIRLQHLCICMVLKFEISKHACSKLKNSCKDIRNLQKLSMNNSTNIKCIMIIIMIKTDWQRSELRMVGTIWFLSSVSGSVDVSVMGLSAIADSPQFSVLPVGKATRFCWAPVCCSSDWGSILAAAVAAVVVFIWDGEIGYKERRKPASTSNIDGSMGYHLIKGFWQVSIMFRLWPAYLSVTSKLKRIVVNCMNIWLQIEQSAWISEK